MNLTRVCFSGFTQSSARAAQQNTGKSKVFKLAASIIGTLFIGGSGYMFLEGRKIAELSKGSAANEGEDVNEKNEGPFTTILQDGMIVIGTHAKGAPEGPYTLIHPNGSIVKGTFVKGVSEGPFTQTKPDGSILKGTCVKGVPVSYESNKDYVDSRFVPVVVAGVIGALLGLVLVWLSRTDSQ